jgi:hypothetical protein
MRRSSSPSLLTNQPPEVQLVSNPDLNVVPGCRVTAVTVKNGFGVDLTLVQT